MGPLDLADIEELGVKQRQQRDKIENAPKDKAIKATDKAHKACNITDREHIENLKNAILSSIDINKAWEGARTVQNWKDPFDVAAAGTARTLEILKPDSWRDAQQNLIEMAAAGHPVKWAGSKLIREIPIVKKGLGKLDEATINLRRNLLASIRREEILPDGTILMSKQSDDLLNTGSGVGKTTPGRYLEKISKDKPISSGRQPGDYTVSELESAIRGPGKEAYKPYLRNQVEKIDLNLGKKLQKKYGGTDEDVKAFIRKQVNAEIEVREALSQLNSKQRDFQIGQLNVDNMTAKEIEEAVKKLSKTTFYELGHIRSAKNVFRYEELMGANRASNMFPEIAENVVDYSKTTGNPIRTVQGNRGRQARTDIPDDILTMTGTSRTIDEEYLKFINPELENVLTDLIPPQHQDRLFKIVEEGWKRFSSAGYPDFAEFLDEVHGIKYYKYNKLSQAKKNSLRVEFNKQKEPVIGKQQLDQFKPFVRRIVDEYIGSIQAGKDLQKYTEKGLASVDMDQLIKMLRIK